MGQRITIDSASLFNKALEVIEAKEFFNKIINSKKNLKTGCKSIAPPVGVSANCDYFFVVK